MCECPICAVRFTADSQCPGCGFMPEYKPGVIESLHEREHSAESWESYVDQLYRDYGGES